MILTSEQVREFTRSLSQEIMCRPDIEELLSFNGLGGLIKELCSYRA